MPLYLFAVIWRQFLCVLICEYTGDKSANSYDRKLNPPTVMIENSPSGILELLNKDKAPTTCRLGGLAVPFQ